MIKGKIENGLHPKVSVEVAGNIASSNFLALIDTGFDLDLALHHEETAKLGLKSHKYIWVTYANGERVLEPLCRARLLWHGKWKTIKVVFSNDEEPAIGTRLLQGSVVTLNFVKNNLKIEEFSRLNRKKK